jgi:Icc-related predicted phosphoesterase
MPARPRAIRRLRSRPRRRLSRQPPLAAGRPVILRDVRFIRNATGLVREVRPLSSLVINYNAHVPPYDSGLDTAVELDEEFRPALKGGVPHEIPVGSTAVREIIQTYQPVLAVHGHIHECRGDTRIGKTLVINPGLEYNTGRIHGAIVRFAGAEIATHQLVVG